MKVKTISYTKTFQVYQFVNDKISIEDTFPSTVSDEECFRQLMERVDALGKIAYPHLFESTQVWSCSEKRNVGKENYNVNIEDYKNKISTTPPPVIDISKEKQQFPSIEEEINACTHVDGITGLESYRTFVENKKDQILQELFDNKLKELTK